VGNRNRSSTRWHQRHRQTAAPLSRRVADSGGSAHHPATEVGRPRYIPAHRQPPPAHAGWHGSLCTANSPHRAPRSARLPVTSQGECSVRCVGPGGRIQAQSEIHANPPWSTWACSWPPARPASKSPAGQASFLIDSRITTHTTWVVIGNTSDACALENLHVRGGLVSWLRTLSS
jgi:hypothetical protein